MVSLNHSTLADNVAELRERFAVASGETVARMAGWLLNRTDGQLQTAFGLSAGEVAAFRARLQIKADALTALQGQVGE